MKLEQFVRLVLRGKVLTPRPSVVDGKIIERIGVLEPTVENIAAEAFNRGILDSDTVTWGSALVQVKALTQQLASSRRRG